jgi:hypothetical protein
MTPRERLLAALRFEPYEGPVPHLELEFQLAEELFVGSATSVMKIMKHSPNVSAVMRSCAMPGSGFALRSSLITPP